MSQNLPQRRRQGGTDMIQERRDGTFPLLQQTKEPKRSESDTVARKLRRHEAQTSFRPAVKSSFHRKAARLQDKGRQKEKVCTDE